MDALDLDALLSQGYSAEGWEDCMTHETWVVEWDGGRSWKRFSRYGDAAGFSLSLFRMGYTDARMY